MVCFCILTKDKYVTKFSLKNCGKKLSSWDRPCQNRPQSLNTNQHSVETLLFKIALDVVTTLAENFCHP